MSIELENIRFLVVEDQPQPMKLMTRMLTQLGAAEVFTACDGEAAINFLSTAENQVDIVLCDWMMPRISGLEVLQYMRDEKMDIPFVMITANVDAKSKMFARDTGVNGYINKPFKIENVESVLADIVRQL